MSELKRLLLAQIGYTEFATRRLLEACSRLTPEQLDREAGASHSSILRTLRHIHDGDRVWLERCLETEVWTLPQGPAPEPSFEFLVQSWPGIWRGYRQWLEGATDADLALECSTLLPSDSKLCGPRWQVVLHSVNHATLHRGQIITMLRGLGLQPPNVDLIGYYVTR
jgi:uncharacterized damage-inducible protein DinB